MATDGLRWGVIGASWIGADFVMPALRESGAQIVAAYSSDPGRAEAYSARNDIPAAYSSLSDFLRDRAIEAVYISSRNHLHYEQVLAAAAAGKAILCEKPMATSLDQGREMVAACDRAGVVLAVNHHMRNAPTLRAMQRLLAEGAIGRPLAVRIFHAFLLPEFLQTWRVSDPKAGGGAILDLTVHDADNVRFLLGDEVAEVVAISSRQRSPDAPVEDAVMGVMRSVGGVVVSFHDAYTISSAPTGVEIHGTEGSLIGTEVLRQGPIGEVVLRRGEDVSPVDVGLRDNLYARGIRHFTDAVRGHGAPVVTGEDGLRSLAVALAVAESARTGRRVAVPTG